MKILLLIFAFAVCVCGQVKTETGKRLDEVDKQIKSLESRVSETEKEITVLQEKYSDDYVGIKNKRFELSKLQSNLLSLQTERKSLLQTKLTTSLPNNQVELLKMIVTQNEKIIELLQSLIPPQRK